MELGLFDALVSGIEEQARALAEQIAALPESDQIDALNRVRSILHEVSPFRAEPVDCVLWVPAGDVEANDYNPNNVAPPEMKLLQRSIVKDGYTQPVVTWRIGSKFGVIDGWHRTRVGKEDSAVRKRVKGYLPVTTINDSRQDIKDRMAATIRHNRARGVHGVAPMTDIVAEMIRQGWNDQEVCAELGMDAEEVLRFKCNTGMADLFKDQPYSRSWE